MGWFWADSNPEPGQASAPAPAPKLTPSTLPPPPPECPMHRPDKGQPSGSFLSSPSPAKNSQGNLLDTSASSSSSHAHSVSPSPSSASAPSSSFLSKLNPLNYMPYVISQEKAPGQTSDLPLARERSTIPKADGSGSFWEYPSPQQMYNAMVRKGYTDTPTDAVESMVAVHNFLNEGAWAEILEWERRFADGLLTGARLSFKGEENARRENGSLELVEIEEAGLRGSRSRWQEELTTEWDEKRHGPSPLLAKFMGRPDELTPKAQMMQLLGWANPKRYGGPPPFDRHDWYVVRHERAPDAPSPSSFSSNKPLTATSATTSSLDETTVSPHYSDALPDGSLPPNAKLVRYVIDYYEGPSDESESGQEQPVFYLDVRPAVDSPDAAARRLVRWCGDVWYRAMGGDAVRKDGGNGVGSSSSVSASQNPGGGSIAAAAAAAAGYGKK